MLPVRNMKSIFLYFWSFFSIIFLCDGQCPNGLYEHGVNQNERDQIVNLHNDLRLLIAHGQLPDQPKGVNLKRFHWDNKLEVDAQNIANTCIYGHVTVSDPRWQVGQNIAANYHSIRVNGANWTEPIMNWWNEYKLYKFGNGFSNCTGHYTQMAWDDTMYIGCGYVFFPQKNGQYNYSKIYVCNYGPSGNYNRAPYKTGNSGCENLC